MRMIKNYLRFLSIGMLSGILGISSGAFAAYTISQGGTATSTAFTNGITYFNGSTLTENSKITYNGTVLSSWGGYQLNDTAYPSSGVSAGSYGDFAGGSAQTLNTADSIISNGTGSFAYGASQGLLVRGSIQSTGIGSFAIGDTNGGFSGSGSAIISSGSGSFAGGDTSAGATTSATYNGSFAWGNGVGATANYATAFGTGYTNSTANSFDIGYSSTPSLTVTGSAVTSNENIYDIPQSPLSGTNCLQINTSGEITNTGSACGSGGTTYTATYPVTLSGSAFGLAFGTTTSNTWAGTQTFNNATFNNNVTFNALTPFTLTDLANQACLGTSSGGAIQTGNCLTSVTGTYPVISSGGTTPALSIAFGTTTANSWSALQNFTNATSTLLSAGTIWDTGLGAGFVQSSASGLLSSAALTSGQVTTALGFTPFGGTNPLPIVNGGTGLSSIGASSTVLTSNGTSAVWQTVSSGGGSGTVGSGTTGQFPYYAANGTALTATSSLFLAASGNVGVGTTSPTTQLDVTGLASINHATDQTASPELAFGTGINAGNYAIGISGGRMMLGIDTNNSPYISMGPGKGFTIYTNGTANSPTSGTNAMTIISGGNVGIGSTTPGSTLSVAGTGYFTGATTVGGQLNVYNKIVGTQGNNVLDIEPGSSSYLRILANNGNVEGTWNAGEGSSLALYNTAAESTYLLSAYTSTDSSVLGFRVDASGDGYFKGTMGIGTSTPTQGFSLVAASSTQSVGQYTGNIFSIFGLENTTLKNFFSIDQWGHITTSGDTPTAAGNNATTASVTGNDVSGAINRTGGGSPSTYTLTFAHPQSQAPNCVANANNATYVETTSVSTTAITFQVNSTYGNLEIWYWCPNAR